MAQAVVSTSSSPVRVASPQPPRSDRVLARRSSPFWAGALYRGFRVIQNASVSARVAIAWARSESRGASHPSSSCETIRKRRPDRTDAEYRLSFTEPRSV
jgi:hypothetical protein